MGAFVFQHRDAFQGGASRRPRESFALRSGQSRGELGAIFFKKAELFLDRENATDAQVDATFSDLAFLDNSFSNTGNSKS